ncbi:aspartate aminotransferase family protein [Lederbergia citrea]|uniref:Aspartate aminotransferase family protein n=1 Tax=Lederbergia citrea TaxID=2833581 RepID=A0A942Z483_9BACI|nr:aspartate aminotransferase family protein [Lederbergia citrea]MBS4176648.1 aspartate aminotransferase family protein [Lederbergia citrea]MBS4203209.1 aspartate aminotransferase family protein [Lederbergia citrea]MBS4222120.1 aspartate aminotransferase family protein [Lederbergia citrea]
MHRSNLIKPLLDSTYPVATKGEGIYLYDDSGKKYIDGCSGAVTANLGHGNEVIIEAISQQLKKVAFTYRSQFTNEPAEKLAELLCKMTGELYPWTFLVNSGSEAIETAIKLAIQHWQEKGRPQKNKIISRWISYHGITNGALSVSGHPIRREKFLNMLGESSMIEAPYCYRCPFGKAFPECGLQCARQLDTILGRIGSDQIAAFIAEPIIGAAGAAITPPEGYYELIKEICDRHNILLISDEVMTGCFRTGKMLASDHWEVRPDIICLGKGLGAGYTPIGAVIVTDEIIDPILKGSNIIMSGHTMSANPLSAAGALAVLEILSSEQSVESITEKITYFHNLIDQLKGKFDFIGDIRGKGLLIGIEFVQNRALKTPYPRGAQFTETLIKTAKNNGLLLYPASSGTDGRNGDAIILSPPLITTEDEMDEMYRLLVKSFEAMEATLSKKEMLPDGKSIQ